MASVDAFNAMRSHPDVEPDVSQAAELAESFDPIICSVVDTIPDRLHGRRQRLDRRHQEAPRSTPQALADGA